VNATGGLWLVVRGPDAPRIVAMTGETLTLGRDLRSDVVLDDSRASRRHAVVSRDDSGHYLLTDLSSRNGTTVDGRHLVGSVVLHGGEILRLGRSIVEVFTSEPEGVL